MKVDIHIKFDQIEITCEGTYILLLRKPMDAIQCAKFSEPITDQDIRRLLDTGIIDIIDSSDEHTLYFKTRRFHSKDLLYLIMADLIKYKYQQNSNNHGE